MQTQIVRFWLIWIALTLAGYALGLLIILPFAIQSAYSGDLPFLVGLASGAVLGTTIGTGQWLLLRSRSRISPAWIGASLVGGMFGMALGMTIEPTTDAATIRNVTNEVTREAAALVIPWRVAWQTAVAGALFGLGLGWGQWWILRQYARSAYWWIFFNGLAWMAGLGIGALIAEPISTIAALAITGLIAASITARVMERWQWEMSKRTGPIPGRSHR